MHTILRCFFVLLLALAPAHAQSAAQLKTELKAKETSAKKDPEKLFETAQWAKEKALAVDAKRLFEAVLKVKPDHAGANEALGNQLVEGKWLAAKDADALRKKALAAEYAASVGRPSLPASEPMLTIRPRPTRSMRGSTA